MVRFNWIEQHEAEEGRVEYDTFVVDLEVNRVEFHAYAVDFICDGGYMDNRPNLFKIYKLACLANGFGPRNIEPIPHPAYENDQIPLSSMMGCLQTSTYLEEYSPNV